MIHDTIMIMVQMIRQTSSQLTLDDPLIECIPLSNFDHYDIPSEAMGRSLHFIKLMANSPFYDVIKKTVSNQNIPVERTSKRYSH